MILASFPIYNTPEVTTHAIASLGAVDKYFVINTPPLEYLAGKYKHIVNEENNYCNGGWNQAMEYFLKGKWKYLALGSADVIMSRHWFDKIPQRDNEVWVPTYSSSLELMENTRGEKLEFTGGVAGAFTVFPREAVRIVYPIPEQLKLWFGDEYMFNKLRSKGWKVFQATFTAYHYGSLGVYQDQHTSNSIIEQDKLEWELIKEKNERNGKSTNK